MATLLLAATLGLLTHGTSAAASACRCLPTDPCWAQVPWKALNASVGGRLQKSVDELAVCVPSKGGDVASAKCAAALGQTDDEFWLADRPNGFQHTGLFNAWNISDDLSEYSVLAETEADFAATIKFAHDHNLRLVVKATGHDWFGRSTAAGSLLLWTHLRKNITWHESFVAEGCAAGSATSAATVQSGVQFIDLYPDAHEQGKIVMGGTCDSVGVAGCWMAGCYGPFTRRFGNGAINILQARVVLANGTVVTASKCSHPDLFASIRGGGGGVAGVVTEFVARSHREPRHMANAGFSGTAKTKAECLSLVARALQLSAATGMNHSAGTLCDNTGLSWGCNAQGGHVSVTCIAYEGDPLAMKAQLQPAVDWAKQQGGSIAGSVHGGIDWNASDYFANHYDPTNPTFPWMERHPDREISTALLASMSKFLPAHYMATPVGSRALARALVDISNMLPAITTKPTVCMMGAKGQAGISAALTTEFHTTTLNPVLLDAIGSWLIMYNVPSLPQVPVSSALLKALWPRLQDYAIRDKSDPLWSVCDAGAKGNETAAVNCMAEWHGRIPGMQAKLKEIRLALWKALPDVDPEGEPFSGSYWCETDYDDLDFANSHWGAEQYSKLLAIKDAYDPDGLFICHHCVGSERWTKESKLNCRKISAQGEN